MDHPEPENFILQKLLPRDTFLFYYKKKNQCIDLLMSFMRKRTNHVCIIIMCARNGPVTSVVLCVR